MFTGIITHIGSVAGIEKKGDWRIRIAVRNFTRDAALGASIACSGACLTVIEKDAGGFTVQASAETLARTTLGNWKEGTRINLERALKVGDELGGHFVSGHVDGLAVVEEMKKVEESRILWFSCDSAARRPAKKIMASLAPQEQQVLRMRFGIDPDTVTPEDVGQEFSVTRERIREIETKALCKLGKQTSSPRRGAVKVEKLATDSPNPNPPPTGEGTIPLIRFIAPKGSVTLDGVSLTVNEVSGERFSVNIIPHTLEHTTLGERKAGDALNLEIDLIARYLARLNEA